MSKVKLYRLFPKYGGPSYGPMVPATTAEIMEAHPKCGECRHLEGVDNRYEIQPAIKVYMVCRSECAEKEGQIVYDPDRHYCRHWEERQ